MITSEYRAEFPVGYELTARELRQARMAFEDSFDRFATDPRAEVLPHMEASGAQWTRVMHSLADGERASVYLRDYAVPSPDGIVKEISITHIDAEQWGRGMSIYRLFKDGIVRRFDIPDEKAKRQAILRRYGGTCLGHDVLDAALWRNHRLEEAQGLNNQPVRPGEILVLPGILGRAPRNAVARLGRRLLRAAA